MDSLARRAFVANKARVLASATKADYPILWVSDSIFNMDELQTATESALTTSYVPSGSRATYGGDVSGAGLMEVADASYAYLSGAWTLCTRGLPFSYFRALVFEFGRNEQNSTYGHAAYRQAYDKILAQGLTYFRQVVTSNCPPQALSNLSDWDTGNDFYNTNYRAACAAVATKWSQRHYDLYSDFLSLVSGATYTVAQLMRDTYHPTYTTGASRLAAQIAAKLLDLTPTPTQTPEIVGRVVNYFFGQPTAGSWALTSTTNAVGPTQGPLPRVANLADQGLLTTTSGAKVVYPDVTVNNGAQVWGHFYGQTAGGGFDAYVDRGTGGEKHVGWTTSLVSNNYPRSFLLASGLTAGTHAIEIEKAANTSPVCLLGMTVVGAT